MPDEFMLIEASAAVEGQPPGNPRVIGLAYSGGKVNLPGWKYPVVVDLAGLELPPTVPLLANHENRTAARVGLVQARVNGGALEIEGEIIAAGDTAQNIVAQGKAGADWQLSIGADVKASETIPAGCSRDVNGRSHEGPFHHIVKASLREVSVVAVGADGSTRLKVTAHFVLTGGPDMDKQHDPKFLTWLNDCGLAAEGLAEGAIDKLRLAFEATLAPAPPAKPTEPAAPPPLPLAREKPANEGSSTDRSLDLTRRDDAGPARTEGSPADRGLDLTRRDDAYPARIAENAIRMERERISAIQTVCMGEYPDIEREAINASWTADQAGQEVLKRIRAARPTADARVTAFASAPKPDTAKTIEAALCLRSGVEEDAVAKTYGDAVTETARRDRNMSMQELFSRCLTLEGKYARTFDNEAIRMAFSTASLPGILSNVANKSLLRAFELQPIIATKLCSSGDLANFNEAQRYRLTDVGDLEPVAPDGKLKHGGVKEEQASNQLDTWGKMFTLTRKMIINDDLGAFMKIPTALGARAARKIDVLFFQRLLKNPNGLFSEKHKNLRTGVDTALNGDSLATAVQMFLDQTDADGQSINIQPKFLLVPIGLRIAARELLHSVTFLTVGATDKTRLPTYNALRDEYLTDLSSSFLSNKGYQGWSDKAWYLFADPQVMDTFEIGYLKGQRTPTVEKTSVDFDELGMRFRVYFDLGVREQDYRGMVKFAGQ